MNGNKYVIYGCGDGLNAFLNLCDIYDKYVNIKYIVDNDSKKHGKMYKSKDVFSPNILENEDKSLKIIICSDNYYEEIAANLNSMGFYEDINYISYRMYIQQYFSEMLFQENIYISLTTRCTLRCKYCSMRIPYIKENRDFSLASICKSIDDYFRGVDYVETICLLGGEPLIYPYISEVIEYILNKYKNRFYSICIITNGTVMPSDELLSKLQGGNIVFLFSDYGNVINIEKRIKIIEMLNKKHIKNKLVTYQSWMDLFLMYEQNEIIENRIKYKNCKIKCNVLYESKYFKCSMSLANFFMNGLISCHDYFDLSVENIDKEKLHDFMKGNILDGYLKACIKCSGTDNNRRVSIAEQL